MGILGPQHGAEASLGHCYQREEVRRLCRLPNNYSYVVQEALLQKWTNQNNACDLINYAP